MAQSYGPRNCYDSERIVLLEADEVLSEVKEVLWLCYGRPKYIMLKLHFSAHNIVLEDLEHLTELRNMMPTIDNIEHFQTETNKKISQQIGRNDRSTRRKAQELTRAKANVEQGKLFLDKLIERIEKLLKVRSDDLNIQAKRNPRASNRKKESRERIITRA